LNKSVYLQQSWRFGEAPFKLEVHGLDRCPDHGIHGFKRYVALAVLARNIQQLGVKLRQKELALLEKQEAKEMDTVAFPA